MAVTARKRRMTRMGNRIGVWMYRTLDGRFSSGSKDVHVLMLTSPGRRTGLPRSTCVPYLETPEGLLVWGTGSGSHRDPDWFRNLRATPIATAQVKDRVMEVRPRELHPRSGMPCGATSCSRPHWRSRFASEAGRVIPVAVLRPLGRGGSRP